jgi:hypothetical protein
MCDFRIIRHNDYHGDAMVFTVVDEEGNECHRFASEADAIDWLPYIEAMAEDEEREASPAKAVGNVLAAAE